MDATSILIPTNNYPPPLIRHPPTSLTVTQGTGVTLAPVITVRICITKVNSLAQYIPGATTRQSRSYQDPVRLRPVSYPCISISRLKYQLSRKAERHLPSNFSKACFISHSIRGLQATNWIYLMALRTAFPDYTVLVCRTTAHTSRIQLQQRSRPRQVTTNGTSRGSY